MSIEALPLVEKTGKLGEARHSGKFFNWDGGGKCGDGGGKLFFFEQEICEIQKHMKTGGGLHVWHRNE